MSTPDASSISTPKQLAASIEGRSDQEVLDTVSAMGIENALERVFEGMKSQFLPDQAKGQSAVIQWDVSALGRTHTYQIAVSDGKCEIKQGAPEKARVTLALALPDFLRLVTGKLNGQQAFFTGKLKLTGDMMFAMTQERWFDKGLS